MIAGQGKSMGPRNVMSLRTTGLSGLSGLPGQTGTLKVTEHQTPAHSIYLTASEHTPHDTTFYICDGGRSVASDCD